jgi:hypothetical protein
MSDYDDWDIEYCNKRLKDCILFSDKKLLRCHKAKTSKGQPGVILENIDLLQGEIVNKALAEIDLSIPKFGFTNLLDRSTVTSRFISRTAIREDWKQGIRAKQLAVDASQRADHHQLFEVKDNIRSLCNTLAGIFEPIKRAICLVEEEYDKIALSRSFAMDDNFKIYYRTEGVIGKLNAEDRILLNKDFLFLKEHIEAELKMSVKT